MLVGMRRNKKREVLPRDKTLWIASHRDSVISNEKNSIELLISFINSCILTDIFHKRITNKARYPRLQRVIPEAFSG